VIAVPADDGGNRLVAYVAAREETSPSAWQLRRDVAERLPSTMVPGHVVVLDALPHLVRGKIDRAALPPPPAVVPYREPHGRAAWIAGLFADVLGVDRVGLDDDFFALGGDSLGALEVVTGISEMFGVDMPTSFLLDAPTPGALVAKLQNPVRPHDALVTVPLVTAGRGLPLFVVAGAGSPALTLRSLAAEVGEPDDPGDEGARRPVYGIQARGLEERARPDRTLPGMARRNIDAMRELYPHGPYAVAGYSFGVVVAFEMAAQLEAAGEQVALLAIIDTQPPGVDDAPPSLAEHLRTWHTWTEQQWAEAAPAPPSRRAVTVGRATARAALWHTKRALVFAGAGLMPRPAIAQEEVFFRISRRAGQRYHGEQHTRGPALLVRLIPRRADMSRVPVDYGWSRWIEGPITVADVPGYHGIALRAPAVYGVAAAFRDALARVDT
jgi:thioesterase domain-containing protein/acyl carrier protein